MFLNIFKKKKRINPYAELVRGSDDNASTEDVLRETIFSLKELFSHPLLKNPKSSENFKKQEYIHAINTQMKNIQERIGMTKMTTDRIIAENTDDISDTLKTSTETLYTTLNTIISEMGDEIKQCLERATIATDAEEERKSLFSCYEASVFMTNKLKAETKKYLETAFSGGRNSLKDEMMPVLEEQKKREEK